MSEERELKDGEIAVNKHDLLIATAVLDAIVNSGLYKGEKLERDKAILKRLKELQSLEK